MSLLVPGALALGTLAIPIILLYMLKLRRREQTISSTLLWRELVKDRTANAPWQRLRRNLLLFLQLLILAALALALARPYWQSTQGMKGNLIVLLDSSASMQARDGEGGRARFADAQAEIERLVDGLESGDQMTLIAAGRTPVVLAAATNERQLLLRVLEEASPENNSADWTAALALAAAISRGAAEPRFIIVSDGALPQQTLPPLPGEVNFLPVGRHDENLAITAMATRPMGEAWSLLVSVANKGSSTGEALLSLYTDGVLLDSRRIKIDADQANHLSWTVPSTTNAIEARLDAAKGTADYLALDNRAWAITEEQAAHRVLLVGDGNLFLERFFTVITGYELVRSPEADMDQLAKEEEAFDLYIFDGVPIPERLPDGSILIVDPQPGSDNGESSPAIQVTRTFTNTIITRLADSPLLADVDWQSVNIAEAQTIAPTGLNVLVAGQGGPLLLAGEIDGRRVVVLPFDLHRSDLPLQIAFPVIMANIMDWLNPGRMVTTDENLQPGAVITLVPNARAGTITIAYPDGTISEISSQGSGNPILFNDTQQTGIYTMSYRSDSGNIRSERFAVNFFNPEESRIRPFETIFVGQNEVVSNDRGPMMRLELWPYLLLIGLAVLTLEWWITYRRKTNRPPLLKTR